MRPVYTLVAALLFSGLGTTLRAQDRPSASATHTSATDEVRAALDSFIVDFNNLDSARFDAWWAPSATAVLPFPDTPHRLDGKEDILARFRRYFSQMRRQRSGPPFLFMVLRDVRVDLLSSGVALVAYEFTAGERVNRRTLVMERGRDRTWRIVQMHGSSGGTPETPG